MKYPTGNDAIKRLNETKVLSDEEAQELVPYMAVLTPEPARRLEAELTLKMIAAVRNFDESSRKLGIRMLALTVVIAVLTAGMLVAAFIPVLLH